MPQVVYSKDLASQSTASPNIVFILADDLGYGDLACYNSQAKVATPHLDRLARDGIRLTDAHSPSTVCTPSRYSLLTGQMAFRIGYRGVFVGVGGPCLIQPDQLTLPQLLRQQGYATAMFGKWHVGLTFQNSRGERVTRSDVQGVREVDFSRPIPDAPIHRGFDEFFGTACCPTTDFLYAFIDGDRVPVPPTRLLDKSHLPQHPYSHDNRLGLIADDFDLQEVDMMFLEKSQQYIEQQVRDHPRQPFFLLHCTQAVHLPSFASRKFQGKTQAGPHGDFIFQFDAIVGELRNTLRRLGIENNTLLIVTSDNGPETTSVVHMRQDHDHDGARPWRGMKRDQWEGGHRVPLLASWPGHIQPGRVSEEPVCLTDMMATCAAAAGAELPPDSAPDSFNVLPALLGRNDRPADAAPIRPYLLHQTIRLDLAIRRGPWKYLDHAGSGGNSYLREPLAQFALPELAPDAPGQLYHLGDDPGETRNLYNQYPQQVRELKGLLELSKRRGRSRP